MHDPGEAPGYYAVKGRKKQLHRLEDVAAEMLQEFMENVKKKHPGNIAIKNAQTELVTGLPVNRILEVAEKNNARMIVMGSQGRTGLCPCAPRLESRTGCSSFTHPCHHRQA